VEDRRGKKTRGDRKMVDGRYKVPRDAKNGKVLQKKKSDDQGRPARKKLLKKKLRLAGACQKEKKHRHGFQRR